MKWLLVLALAVPALVFIGFYAWALWGIASTYDEASMDVEEDGDHAPTEAS